MGDDWYCYILKNETKTYNGSTNNIARRLRQHNGEISGGAKYTKTYGNGDWHVYFLMSGFSDRINCLQAEWRIKHPTNKKRIPPSYKTHDGIIKGVNEILDLIKWTGNSTILNNTQTFTIWIIKSYAHLLIKTLPNITINIIDAEYIDIINFKKTIA